MTEQEYESFNNFINELLYEKMSTDDYDFIMRRLGAKSNGIRYNTICHNSDGGKYNLAFIGSTKTYYCHSECCCAYSLLGLIKKRRKILGEPCSTYASLKWLCEQLDIPFNFKDNNAKINTNMYRWQNKLSKYTKSHKDSVELKIYDKNILNNFDISYYDDWINYGISTDVLDKYKIRWYNYLGQIVIPCYDKDGNLIGIRIRNTNPNIEVKYKPLQLLDGREFNFPTNEVFYGENFNSVNVQRTKSVILVESEKTVMKYESWYGADNNICLGLYGSNLGKSRLKHLLELGCNTFYIALDSDFTEVGDNKEYLSFEKKVMKIYNLIKPYTQNIYVIYNNLGFKDCYKYSITDYTKEQFEQLWESKEKINT